MWRERAGGTGAHPRRIRRSVLIGAALGVLAVLPPAAAEEGSAAARIHDTTVFVLERGHGATTAEQRAQSASAALARVSASDDPGPVRAERQGDAMVVLAGPVRVVELYQEDADQAGQPTLEAHAARVADAVRSAVASERQRSAIAGTVFSLSLVVFFGLIAHYVIQKVGEFLDRARQWTLDNPDRITGIRVQSQEVVGPTALRGGVLVALIVGRFVAQAGVFYLWLVFALSLFESTRPLTARLTGIVVHPLSELAGRLAASLPLGVMGLVSGIAVYVLLRFVQLFFEGVARRQTAVPWLPPDLAAPTSVLVRLGILLVALLLVAPLVTGDPDGALVRVGSVALAALGLSATPLVATMLAGAVTVYGRRLRPGDHVEIGARAGRVLVVGLLDVRLRDAEGCEVRVPHLASLLRPVRVQGPRPRVSVELPVPASVPPAEVCRILLAAARPLGDSPLVELERVDSAHSLYRVTVTTGVDRSASDVRIALVEALAAARPAPGGAPGG